MNDYQDQREHNHGSRVVAGPTVGALRGAAMRATEPAPPSITARMEMQAGRIDELEKSFAALSEAIAHILRTVPEHETIPPASSAPAQSDLSMGIEYANDRLTRLLRRIEAVRAAVDL